MAEPHIFTLRFPRLVETRFRFPPPEPAPGLVIVGPRGLPGSAGRDGVDGAATIPPILDGGHF